MSYALGQLAQIIHVTDDLARARHLYGEVLGGVGYYEGYSPFEKRDASIYAIGDVTMEPMSPSDEPGALDYPVGRFLTRFGPRLHSIAINATGVLDLATELIGAGIRVVGPGGVPVDEISPDGPVSIYTHPRDSHVMIEFVDFGAPLMPASPRLDDGWDAAARAATHPAGVIGLSYVTVVVSDLERASAFFTDVLAAPVEADPVDDGKRRTARVRLGTEVVVELAQPIDPDSAESAALSAGGEGLYSVTMITVEPDRAAAHLDAHGFPTSRCPCGAVELDPSTTAGAQLTLVPISA